MISPQRMLNKETLYSHQNSFMLGIKISQIHNIIQASSENCERCLVKKKNHYCMEISCPKKQLICINCDTKNIQSKHYMHDFSYVMPLFSTDIFQNFYKMRDKFECFHANIQEEIEKIKHYIQELKKIEEIAFNQLHKINLVEKEGRIDSYHNIMEQFLKLENRNQKLKDVLHDVKFIGVQECVRKQEEMVNELLLGINNLKYPKDPQKILRDKLKGCTSDEKKQIFISSLKQINISEIDSSFRVNNEFFTENLNSHAIELKIENDFLTKSKYYETFIYHFRDCSKLCIDNGNINHIRTPLSFRKLKELEFNCNIQTEQMSVRLDNLNQSLTSITLRRFREDDLKFLKYITNGCKGLKDFHIQFYNKTDLFSCKELIEYLKVESTKDLNSFTLKIRTENEVKRLYGFLIKFYKDHGADITYNLNHCLIDLLEKNANLTKVVIEGVKPLDTSAIMAKLKQMPFLMDYKIYYENIDLMTEIDTEEVKKLEALCYQRKRVFYGLLKSQKFKYYDRSIISRVFSQFLT